MIQEYDNGFERAQQFQRRNRDLFSSCTSQRSLCSDGPSVAVHAQERVNTQSLAAWQSFYQRRVEQTPQNRPNSCSMTSAPNHEEQMVFDDSTHSTSQ